MFLCNSFNFDKMMCYNLCRKEALLFKDNTLSNNNSKKDYAEGCKGNGREACYKLCRLEHEASIKTCLEICCS